LISYLKHNEIDKAKWDQCINDADNSLIYAFSWYLDIASPGWEALVLDDYKAVFPITHRKKIFRYLYQPFFTQQLGLFVTNQNQLSFLAEFIVQLKKNFKYADIQLNYKNTLIPDKVKLKRRKNYILELNRTIVEIQSGFNTHTLRNIKKAEKSGLIISTIDSNNAVEFYIKEKADVTARVERNDYDRLKKLLVAANQRNYLISRGAYTTSNELVATLLVYNTPNRLYIINNCVNQTGKELRAMYLLITELIKEFASKEVVLDFEGSDREGIAAFNKGFGAIKQNYVRLKFNQLPWILRLLKN